VNASRREPDFPALTEDEARFDRFWFGDHPARLFLARHAPNDGGWWLIRKRGLLRTFTRTLTPAKDSDAVIGPLWFLSAWPGLGPADAVELASGLVLHECSASTRKTARGGYSCGAKPQLDGDGRHRTDLARKKLYTPVVEITGRERREAFQAQALAVVNRLLGQVQP
jgi:hypothetical protein